MNNKKRNSKKGNKKIIELVLVIIFMLLGGACYSSDILSSENLNSLFSFYENATTEVKFEDNNNASIVVENGKVLSILPLPIAGLMSDKTYSDVLKECKSLQDATKKIGCTLDNPFMTMAFLSLSVIPEIKITDKGVFDVCKSEFIDIFE